MKNLQIRKEQERESAQLGMIVHEVVVLLVPTQDVVAFCQPSSFITDCALGGLTF